MEAAPAVSPSQGRRKGPYRLDPPRDKMVRCEELIGEERHWFRPAYIAAPNAMPARNANPLLAAHIQAFALGLGTTVIS
jgi:hypothetical protein